MEPLKSCVASGTGVDSGVEGEGGGLSGAEWVYVDVCAQGKLLSGHQAVHWRLNLTEGGLPLLASEDIDSERHASLLAAAADVDVLERVCACVCACESFAFLCVHFVYARARPERTYAPAQTHAHKHTRAHKTKQVLKDVVQAYVERDWPEMVERYSDSLRALLAAKAAVSALDPPTFTSKG